MSRLLILSSFEIGVFRSSLAIVGFLSKRLDEVGVALDFDVDELTQVLAERLRELQRVVIAHTVVLQDKKVVGDSTQAGVQIAEVVKEHLVYDSCFTLSWMSAGVQQPARVRLYIVLNETPNSLLLARSANDQVVLRAAEHVEQR